MEKESTQQILRRCHGSGVGGPPERSCDRGLTGRFTIAYAMKHEYCERTFDEKRRKVATSGKILQNGPRIVQAGRSLPPMREEGDEVEQLRAVDGFALVLSSRSTQARHDGRCIAVAAHRDGHIGRMGTPDTQQMLSLRARRRE